MQVAKLSEVQPQTQKSCESKLTECNGVNTVVKEDFNKKMNQETVQYLMPVEMTCASRTEIQVGKGIRKPPANIIKAARGYHCLKSRYRGICLLAYHQSPHCNVSQRYCFSGPLLYSGSWNTVGLCTYFVPDPQESLNQQLFNE